jgi:agmatine deiminase
LLREVKIRSENSKDGSAMKKRNVAVIIAAVTVLILSLSRFWSTMQNKKNYELRRPYTENINETAPVGYRYPAEFEKQQAIWMLWPSEIYDEGEHPVSPVIMKIVKSLACYIKVNIAAKNSDEIIKISNMLKEEGYKGTNVHFYEVDHLSIWARDVGPICIKDSSNHLRVVDFGFNNYSRDGSEQYISMESQVDKRIANLFEFPVIDTSLVSEGGAIESNGRGTLMLTESVVLKRNPGLTREQIENEYKRVLGVSNIIWLKKGLAEDDRITSGHINEICRFASADTILLAEILPSDRYVNEASNESYLRMEENYEILKNAADQDGKPFKIIRVPMPPTVYQKPTSGGAIPIRSYLNYCVTNGAVIMQTYWRPGLSDALKSVENEVKTILEKVYPGRDIIGIDAMDVNLWGGGIHCITQHIPE